MIANLEGGGGETKRRPRFVKTPPATWSHPSLTQAQKGCKSDQCAQGQQGTSVPATEPAKGPSGLPLTPNGASALPQPAKAGTPNTAAQPELDFSGGGAAAQQVAKIAKEAVAEMAKVWLTVWASERRVVRWHSIVGMPSESVERFRCSRCGVQFIAPNEAGRLVYECLVYECREGSADLVSQGPVPPFTVSWKRPKGVRFLVPCYCQNKL